MGIYLNPGNENFTRTLRSADYVDKSMMIRELNRIMETDKNYICVSRPRRFGKTIAGNMISSYFSKGCDSKELFKGLKIGKEYSGLEEKLNQYNVIKIDMNSEYQGAMDKSAMLQDLTEDIKDELRDAFPNVAIRDRDSLARSIQRIYSATKETFIIILDEYDVLVRERAPQELMDEYLGFLNGLFKSDSLRPAIALAYLTGILPIVRDKIQSKLNNFDEYTIIDAGELSEYVGFTEAEVRELCEKHGMDFAECRRWYDGYRLKDFEIYNPESVIMAMRKRNFNGYWNATSSYEAILDRIRMNFAGTKDAVIRLLSGEKVDVNVTSFLNTMDSFRTRDDLLTYLIHLGYLAFDVNEKINNRNHGTCRIPNQEIVQEWENAVAANEDYTETDRIIKASKELLTETINGNEEAVSKALDESHIHVTSNRSYNNEDALQSAIYLAYIYALNQYTIVREMTSGKGFADVTFIPWDHDLPAMIIELKRNGSVDSAIEQIRERQYFKSLERYAGKLLFVGINYDEKEKTHSCRIERFQKDTISV